MVLWQMIGENSTVGGGQLVCGGESVQDVAAGYAPGGGVGGKFQGFRHGLAAAEGDGKGCIEGVPRAGGVHGGDGEGREEQALGRRHQKGTLAAESHDGIGKVSDAKTVCQFRRFGRVIQTQKDGGLLLIRGDQIKAAQKIQRQGNGGCP